MSCSCSRTSSRVARKSGSANRKHGRSTLRPASALVEGTDVAADNGVVLAGPALVRADAAGATLWRWDVAPSGTDPVEYRHRTALRCSGPVEPATIADDLLLRLDSVAFPPGGTALLHTHQGPGIRCLKEGDIRIDTAGHSTTYCPGGAWFEEGPEPVFAQASASAPSRFIRSMVLPRAPARHVIDPVREG